MLEIAIALIIAAIIGILILPLASTLLTLPLSHPTRKSHLINLTSICGIILVLLILVVISLDVIVVKYGGTYEESDGDYPYTFTSPSSLPFKIAYYTLFTLILLHTFITLPFAYFFHEAGDSEIPLRKRLLSAFKYCILGVLALVFLCIVSIIISFFPTSLNEPTPHFDWNQLSEMNSYFVNAVAFLIGSVACVMGLGALVLFLGCGLGAMPLSILGRLPNRISMQLGNLTEEQDIVTERMGVLRTKRNMGKRLSKREEKEFSQLQERKSLLANKETVLAKQKEMSTLRRVLQVVGLVVRFPLALLLLVISIVLLVSLIASSVHRLIASGILSGVKALFSGFTAPEVFEVHIKDSFYLLLNPLDFILVMSSWAYPLDYILFCLTLCFFVWVTLGSMHIFWRPVWRIICLKCGAIRWRRTNPQSILLRTVVFMFAMVAFMFVLFSFAPQYVSFGSQQYYDFKQEQWRFCNLGQMTRTNDTLPQPHKNETDASGESLGQLTDADFTSLTDPPVYDPLMFRPCYLTEIASLVHNVSIRTWGLFGILIFAANFVIVIFAVLGFLISLYRLRPKLPTEDEGEDDEESLWEDSNEGVIQ